MKSVFESVRGRVISKLKSRTEGLKLDPTDDKADEEGFMRIEEEIAKDLGISTGSVSKWLALGFLGFFAYHPTLIDRYAEKMELK